MKVNYIQFKQIVESAGKSFFSLPDLKKFYPASRENLLVLLSVWTKKNLIYHLGRGFYSFNLSQVDYLSLANALDPGSYISFEYALSYHNLIDQVPSVITCATKKRSRKIKMSNWTFEFTRLKNDLFFGYDLKNKIYLATPEKALADLLYLLARGKRSVDLESLEKKKINQKKLCEILTKFPKYTVKKAMELGILK